MPKTATTTSAPGLFERARHRLVASDYLTTAAIGLGYFVLLALTDRMGFTRDESFYFHAGTEYAGWFKELLTNLRAGQPGLSFEQASIDAHWSYNPEHPVLIKTLFGLSWWILSDTLHWVSPSLAFRLPAMAFGGLWIAMTWLFTREVFGSRRAAWFAAATMGAMPHVFFHAHLACFDVPVAAIWLVTVFAWWKSLDNARWAWATGLLWGIGLTIKLNMFFLPGVFLLHAGLLGLYRAVQSRGGTLRAPRIPLALVTMALLGPIVFHLGWPLQWYETYKRFSFYIAFHSGHEHYYVDYLGRGLWEPPFPIEYPFVLTGITTPMVVLAAMLAGMVVALAAWARSPSLPPAPREASDPALPRYATGTLLALNIVIPFAIIAHPDTPVFGGVKHWFPALPFMSMFAGYGLMRLCDGLASPARSLPGATAAAASVLAVYLASPVYATWFSHPFGISYYNELIGGYTGAADAQTMRQFWGYASRQALPWVNANVPKGARVAWHDTTSGAYEMYKREGLLRPDVGATWDYQNADYLLFDVQRALNFALEDAWSRYGTQAPVETISIAGVPLITVYPNLARLGRTADNRDEVPEPEGDDGEQPDAPALLPPPPADSGPGEAGSGSGAP